MKKLFTSTFLAFAPLLAQTSYNVSLYGQMNKYGTNPNASNYSAVWGWTDTVKNREYAFIGSPLGTSVVDITTQPIKEVSLRIGPPSTYNYHEFRTYKNYLYIGSEGTDINLRAGIQIVDLSTLPDSGSFKKVYVWLDTNSTTGATRNYYRAHTVSIEKNFLYVNGGDFGGTRIMDISDPLNPLQVGSYGKGGTPYVHDAVIRNDTLYAACINAGRLDIIDFTVKGHYNQNTTNKIVSKTPTVPEGRTHQVWLSENGKYAFVATEAPGTVQSFTYNLHIYDITNRTNPVQIATWTSDPAKSIHNVFVKGDFLYIAYYTDGFRVLDISNPQIPIEVAFYKTYTNSNPPLFAGVWGAYPYFPSGKVAVSDMNTGLYVFTVDEKKGGRITGVVRDAATQQVVSGVDVLVEEMGRKYTTDASGTFTYGTGEGSHTIKFSKTGYIARIETVLTKAGTIDTVTILLSSNTGTSVIDRQNRTPETFDLSQNFPNPFNPNTKIVFSLKTDNFTSLRVYNALGQEVATLVDQKLPSGTYSVSFDARNLPSGISAKGGYASGVYFYTLNAGNFSSTKKMVLTK